MKPKSFKGVFEPSTEHNSHIFYILQSYSVLLSYGWLVIRVTEFFHKFSHEPHHLLGIETFCKRMTLKTLLTVSVPIALLLP